MVLGERGAAGEPGLNAFMSSSILQLWSSQHHDKHLEQPELQREAELHLLLEQLINGTVEMETESVWTGLRFVNGQWFWVSGEQPRSLVSMPSCPVQSYSCGALNTMTNTLNNQNCNERLNFICYWK
ncbi:hypothetical protein KOW79_003024 [Hemibagrus wyckioides]|uniref:C-type lectin domain-containing protein n=1 Tax=Hemibagrus wyckioides TaxID=337641 RepID=A0A9D3P2E2_9TELE|nr:hypothetical protein KOW79_003024 [Hemibagrus wyckioides]